VYIYTRQHPRKGNRGGGGIILCLGDGVADVSLFDIFEGHDDGVYCSEVIPYSSLCGCPVVQLDFLRVRNTPKAEKGGGGLGRGRLRMGGFEGQKQRAVHMEMAVQGRAKTFLQFLRSPRLPCRVVSTNGEVGATLKF
jgi:hypothetical protein